jgi:mitochondrial fission protein ELM1
MREVWACSSSTDRAGDLDQVYAIAWVLDPRYKIVDLPCEFDRLQRALGQSAGERPISWPNFIVGIGRNRLEQAIAIRQWSRNRTKLVHIGRLRNPLEHLDYLVTTPAYPISPSPKIISLDIALSEKIRRMTLGRDMPLADESRMMRDLSERGIRPNWINVFVGNPLRSDRCEARLGLQALARQLDRLAARYDKDLVISGAPRTQDDAYDLLGSALSCRHYLYRWAANDPDNPFALMIRRGRDSVVTADSISMISQLVAAGHRTLIFPWPTPGRLTSFFHKRSKRTTLASKDMAAFRANLYEQAFAAELDGVVDFEGLTPRPGIQNECFRRLRKVLVAQ